MADRIYLSGGPCDGKTVSANQIQGGLVGYIACGGGYYTLDSAGRHHDGLVVFDYAGKTKPGPPGGSGDDATRAHHGWTDVRRSVNKRMPHALSASQRNSQAALRTLNRARRVRI